MTITLTITPVVLRTRHGGGINVSFSKGRLGTVRQSLCKALRGVPWLANDSYHGDDARHIAFYLFVCLFLYELRATRRHSKDLLVICRGLFIPCVVSVE